MNKTIDKVQQFTQYLSGLKENHRVNGNFSDDSLMLLYQEAKGLEKESKDFRKNFLKNQIKERAQDHGYENEKGHAVLEGEKYSVEIYDRARSQVNFDYLKDFFLAQTEDHDIVEQIFGLLKKSGFSKTAISDAIQDGDLPSSVMSKEELSYEDHVQGNYLSGVSEKVTS